MLPPSVDTVQQLHAINSGTARIRDSLKTSLKMSIQIVLEDLHVVSDLECFILRNHTDHPFIAADSPSVLINHYMRSVRDRGVLGMGCTGLMISMPIDARTSMLFLDPTVYRVHDSKRGCVDVTSNHDIAALNAIQIHAADQNVYFGDPTAQGYVLDLVAAQKTMLSSPRGSFQVHKPGMLLLDGKPTNNDILHCFEPQLPITLQLSFVKTSDLGRHDFATKTREAARLRSGNRTPKSPRHISGRALVSQIESHIEF
jgi:hypothetical protein